MYYKNNYIVVCQIIVINQLVDLKVQDKCMFMIFMIVDFLNEKWIAILSLKLIENGHMWLAIY